MRNPTEYVGGALATVDPHVPTGTDLEVRVRAVTLRGVWGELCPQPGQFVIRRQAPTVMGGVFVSGVGSTVASATTDLRIAPNAKPVMVLTPTGPPDR